MTNNMRNRRLNSLIDLLTLLNKMGVITFGDANKILFMSHRYKPIGSEADEAMLESWDV